MLDQLLPLLPTLPNEARSAMLAVLAVAALVGLILWIMGSRFQRTVLTLLAVAAGGVLGLILPRSFNWQINPMTLSTAAAVVCGLSAFILPRLWVALGLAAIAALWAALACWVYYKAAANWSWPSWEGMEAWPQYLRNTWDSLNGDFRAVAPYVAGVAALAGLLIGALWRRAGSALFFSLVGETLLIVAALSAVIVLSRPEWLDRLAGPALVQAAVLIGLALLGMAIQLTLFCGPATAPPPQHRRGPADEPE